MNISISLLFHIGTNCFYHLLHGNYLFLYIFFLLLKINNSDKFKLMTKEKRSHMMHIYTTVLCFVQSYLIQSSLAIWIGSSELKYNIFILSDNI